VIVDAHVHVWPDALARRAIGDAGLSLTPFGDGTVAALTQALDTAGIDRAVCLAVAPRAEHVDAANRFVGGLDRTRFVGFGSIHPATDAAALVESLRANRLPGAKAHPAFQRYSLDDPRLDAIWDALQGEFAVTIHVGKVGDHDDGGGCTPAMVRSIVDRFPRLDVIACHFGGYLLAPEAQEVLVGRRVYLDTSWPPSVARLEPARIRTLIERHGADRVVFGSDWPMGDPAAERAAIEGLGLSGVDTAAVLGGNIERICGLRPPA
jgi:predicted TIM-barrel fold metal-dependent hydrolase